MTAWEMVQELMENIELIDIVFHQNFIENVFEHGDPNNLEEELTERQLAFIDWLWERYCNDNWEPWEDVMPDPPSGK